MRIGPDRREPIVNRGFDPYPAAGTVRVCGSDSGCFLAPGDRLGAELLSRQRADVDRFALDEFPFQVVVCTSTRVFRELSTSARFADVREMYTDWALSKMCAEGAASNGDDQDRTKRSNKPLRSEFVGR
jgi:hypothetical protein